MSESLFARVAGRPLWLRVLAFAACAALVAFASTYAPVAEGPGLLPPFVQHLAHAPLYALFAASFLILLGPRSPLRTWAWALTLTLTGAAGFLDEWNQLGVPGRGSDLLDLVTDLLGGYAALLLASWAARRPLDLRRGALRFGSAALLVLAWGLYSYSSPLVPLPFVGP